jgi:hypothetical protein
MSAGEAVSNDVASSDQRAFRQAKRRQIARKDFLALGLPRHFKRDVDIEPPPNGLIDVRAEVGRRDQKAGVLLDPLQQRVDFLVAAIVEACSDRRRWRE